MDLVNFTSHMNLEFSLDGIAQLLQIQAIEKVHESENGELIFLFDLSKVDLDYPVVRFNKRVKLIEGDVEFQDVHSVYPGYDKERYYMYLNPLIISNMVRVIV